MSFSNTQIQKYLNQLNAGLTVDGVIGEKSKFWIYGLQYAGSKTNGLAVDGIFGNKTYQYLKTIDNKKNVNTSHFSQSEFKCKCCGSNCGIDINLLILLEAIRYKYKRSITITSGYRCSKHNKNVGGVSNSQHLYGRAADIVVTSTSSSRVYSLASSMNAKGGVGRYTTFTHVDCRGTYSRW